MATVTNKNEDPMLRPAGCFAKMEPIVGTSSVSAMRAPLAEVDIDGALVEALLCQQHPDLSDRPLKAVGNGWDNAIFRLGQDLAVRLPRRALSVPLVEHEQRWLPVMAKELPLPIPVPVRLGLPGCGYPWPWTIVPWFPGSTADGAPPESLVEIASQLGLFLASLHRPAANDAPVNPYRGVPLANRDERLRMDLEELGDAVDRAKVLAAWNHLRRTPVWSGPPLWLHGDVHPLNLLVRNGRLSAVIDFGDLCAGDPATDLAVGWMLFPDAIRPTFRAAVDVDADTWQRGRAWALALGVAWAKGSERLAPIGWRALTSALRESS